MHTTTHVISVIAALLAATACAVHREEVAVDATVAMAPATTAMMNPASAEMTAAVEGSSASDKAMTTVPVASSATTTVTQSAPTTTSTGILPLSPESYIDRAGIWKRSPVPVCWESGARASPREIAWVEAAVLDVMEKVSSIRFGGVPGSAKRWPTCAEQTLGIRISVSTLQPVSQVGQQ